MKNLFGLFLVILFCVIGCTTVQEEGPRSVSWGEYRKILVHKLDDNKTTTFMHIPSVVKSPDGKVVDIFRASEREVYEEFHRTNKVIYGLKDDRQDYYEVRNRKVRNNMDSVASLWKSYSVQRNINGTYTLRTRPFGESMRMCEDEPFYEQPVGAFCTGFLVGDDVLVTAGHCVNETSLMTMKVVFGYRMKNTRQPVTTVKSDNVYGVESVIQRRLTRDGLDYAVLRLDRKVTNRQPLCMAKRDVVEDENVYVIGYPVGLPIKYADDARVTDTDYSYTFQALLDTYGGNSGSPVFNDQHEVVGILVRGRTDFTFVDGCRRSVMVPLEEENWSGEHVTKVSTWRDLLEQ